MTDRNVRNFLRSTRIAVATLCGLLVVGLAGCASNSSGDSDDATSECESETCPEADTGGYVDSRETEDDATSDTGAERADSAGGRDSGGADSRSDPDEDGGFDGSDGDATEDGPVHYGSEHPERSDGGWERPESMVWTEIGGGTGYGMKICEPPAGATEASTKAELLSALESAGDGDVVWVPGSAEIDLTGEFNTVVPAGATLASDRGCGNSDGARLLHTTGERTEAMFVVESEARITGFELRGYGHPKRGSDYTPAPRDEVLAYGITVAGDRAQVDNNHITSFVGKCISIGGTSSDVWVHHNRIEWCHRLGYGYGVSMGDEVNALIEFNRIDNTRHAVAAAGSADCFYEARYNVIGPYRQNHTLDMHGTNGVGGKRLIVHHNTIIGRWTYESGGTCTGGQPYVDVRAEPAEPLQIHRNWMVDQLPEYAIDVVGDKYEATDNHIDASEPACDVGAPRRGCASFAPSGETPTDPEYEGYSQFGSYNIDTGDDDGDPCLEPPVP